MIQNLKLYRTLNSKGTPGTKVKVFTDSGCYSASVPSGTSKGIHEVKEIAFEEALKVFPEIRKQIIGTEEDHRKIDAVLQEVDGTGDFGRIGGNISLAVSVAVAKAQTRGELWRLGGLHAPFSFPLLVSNMIGGGAHSGGTEWQEFLVIPYKVKDPFEATEIVTHIWGIVGEELKRRNLLLGRNIENAWMSRLDDMHTLDFLASIAEDWHVKLGVDFAASHFWNGRVYRYRHLKKELRPEEQIDFIKETAEKYRLYYLEDPFHEEDFDSFGILNRELKGRCLVIGDDLYCTNRERFEIGVKSASTNAIIIKPNQIGTLSRAWDVVRISGENGITPILSHRSGETEDPWLSDLALAWRSPLIKIGVLNPDLPKHNRLIELWDDVPDGEMARLP